MKDYPLEKYKFIHVEKNGKHKVIALSTFAGKRVRGVAVCHENDEFNLEYGKKLAAARCNLKVAEKRRERAYNKLYDADIAVMNAHMDYEDARNYYNDAIEGVDRAITRLDNLLGGTN